MKRGFVLWSVCLTMAMPMLACHREEKIEDTPVAEIKVSEPPEYEVPEKHVVRYGNDGIFKVADHKYFGVVVPIESVEISKSDEEIRFYVPGMSMTEIMFFLDKYFPYQKYKKYTKVEVIEVFSELKEEYADGSIVPSLDVNVVRPTEENAVSMRIFWDPREQRFEWIYRNPELRKANRVEFLADGDAVPPVPEKFVMPSDEEIQYLRETVEPAAFEKQYAEMKRLAEGGADPRPDEESGPDQQARPDEMPGGSLLIQNMMMDNAGMR